MEKYYWRDIKRRKSNTIKVGSLTVGGNSPISVQSMTNTKTSDADRTIKQVKELEDAGAEDEDWGNTRRDVFEDQGRGAFTCYLQMRQANPGRADKF